MVLSYIALLGLMAVNIYVIIALIKSVKADMNK